VKNKESLYDRRNLCISCACKRNKAQSGYHKWQTDHQVMKRYGITGDVYRERMKTSSACEICGKTEELCYDHCHTTMKFRGVLCRGCNRSIGQLGDTAEALFRAADYLKRRG